MNKVSIDDVAFFAKKLQFEDDKVNELIKTLKTELENAQEERQPRTKKQFVLLGCAANLGSDLQEEAERVLNSLPLYLFQMEEDDDHNQLADRVEQIGKKYNATKKESKPKATTIIDVIELAPAKLFKEEKVGKKTKTPVISVIAK